MIDKKDYVVGVKISARGYGGTKAQTQAVCFGTSARFNCLWRTVLWCRLEDLCQIIPLDSTTEDCAL